MKIFQLAAPAALIALLALPAVSNADTFHQRQLRQHERIEQGIRSGELTYGEQYRLEGREMRFHRTEARDRAFDHGHLTRGERFRLNRDLNRDSHAIYRDKHNGAVRTF